MNFNLDRVYLFLQKPIPFCIVLIFCLAFIYSSQFPSDPFLLYDDLGVINIMGDIHSFADYVATFQAGKIYDVQPIRDFVTAIDYWILGTFHVSLFHVTNVLIWISTVLGLRKLAGLRPVSEQGIWSALVMLIAVNPLYVSTVSWLSARKHLLASACTVWCTYYFFVWLNQVRKPKREMAFFTSFYACAVFSQPIVILWPVFAACALVWSRQTRYWKSLLPAILVMGLCLGLNLWYYASPYYLAKNLGVVKYSDYYNDIPAIRLFAVGRYVFQVFVPYWTSVSIYALKSWRGLVGIFFLPLSFFWFFKSQKNKGFVVLGFGFFFLMIAPVVVRMTQIFGNDSYVLTASFALYALLGFTLLKPAHRFRIGFSFLFLAVFTGFVSLSHERAQAWGSDLDVFQQGKEVEGNIESSEQYLHELMHARRYREAAWHAEEILREYPESNAAQGVISYAIFTDETLSSEQKIEKILSYRFFTPYSLDILAKLEFSVKHYRESEKMLLSILDLREWTTVVRAVREEFTARIYASCILAKDHDCEKKLIPIKEKLRVDWNEQKYQTSLRELGISETRENQSR